MRKNIIAASLVAGLMSTSMLVAVASPAQAADVVTLTVAQQVAALLAANPNGGPALSDGIAALFVGATDPAAVSSEILAAVASANDDQKASVGEGFATAHEAYAAAGNNVGANAVEVAIGQLGVDDHVRLAYLAAGGTTGSIDEDGVSGGGQASKTLITNNSNNSTGSDSTSPH